MIAIWIPFAFAAFLAVLAAGLIRCGCLTITARRPPRGKQAGCPLAPKGGGTS